jgi:NitT/TauT family transport system ATP-binding protein
MAIPAAGNMAEGSSRGSYRDSVRESDSEHIVCRNISHHFISPGSRRPIEALHSINLSFDKGEFVAIVGPSGCGKTTLLNMLAGLVTPAAGQILIDGKPSRGIARGQLGYMFARDTLLPWRNVQKNVELALEFTKVRDRSARARDLIAAVGLSGFESHYPHQLSQGMRQRVTLARTLLRDPQYLLMDEPFGALDAQTRVKVQGEFLRLWGDRASTIVLVTHDISEAVTLADRVIVFSARPGRVKLDMRISLCRPRHVDDLQSSSEFRDYFQAIWQELRDEVGISDERADG